MKHSSRLTIDWHKRTQDEGRDPSRRHGMPLIQPYMIFASGWRCGSTMLQRMLMAGLDKCVIWGEPWEEYEFHRTMMEQFLQDSDVHQHLTQEAPNLKSLPFSQTANMNPGFRHLRECHHQFWRSLLWNRQLEPENFGVKWVHADKQVIRYFKFLFPQFRPLLLVRNPFAALSSYMTAIGTGPNSPGWCRSRRHGNWIKKPKAFLRQWYNMAQGFEDLQGEAQCNSNWGPLQVFKYEDFLETAGPGWSQLARYIPELNMPAARLAQAYRVNHTNRGVPRYEVPNEVADWFFDKYKYPFSPFYDLDDLAPYHKS